MYRGVWLGNGRRCGYAIKRCSHVIRGVWICIRGCGYVITVWSYAIKDKRGV